jgi:lipopolysaccharide/colanic/teichoic acid biosynthesis glycosyltransferase
MRARSSAVPVVPAFHQIGSEAALDGRLLLAWVRFAPSDLRVGWYAKRCLDVVVAAVLLALTAPLLLVAVLLVRATSRGPALFLQQRIGYRGRPFTMYKLRTMVDGAARLEDRFAARARGNVFFKLDRDPRVTRIGRLLRRTSIDELPQLLNVLRGEMSLVGPRPLLESDLRNFPQSPDRLRFAMLPGLTGLWQVSGRSARSQYDRLQLDSDYVERWSFWLDLELLARTIPAVLSGRGAL